MKKITIGGEVPASEIALGFWRLAEMSVADASRLVKTALDEGIDFFDHADVYGAGKSETMFAKAAGFTPSRREKVVLQSKCGIRLEDGTYFDFSRDHIVSAAEAILRRLDTEYLDILLLHRPDALVEPEEVAEAFATLHAAGKVRYFGVSNQRPNQMELLRKCCNHKIVANQLQFSITNSGMVDSGLATNMEFAQSVNHDGDVLDYCRLHNITIQAWSPFQYGDFKGSFLGNRELYPGLNDVIDKLAREKGVTNTAIAAAWILRHPARIQVIVGTSKPQRVKDACAASGIELTRPEWYALWKAAGNTLP
ncbi:MAG: aldo/keto reductase [Planctomycetota bacterium]|jgi:predicted oxidoreductase|nr:aldo/keto reductase [Planctomycetota bacterium]